MEIFESIILGVIQGLTEFLPVSSSGHLVLFQQIFSVDNVPLFYDVMLHMGTLVAVFIIFAKDIKSLICHPVQKLMGMLLIATVPAVLAALFLEDFFKGAFEGTFLAFGFFGTAIILCISELIAKRIALKKHIGVKQAVTMGIMQAVAIMPGVSRSGSSIAGGLFSGVDRTLAARFAFLMSIPTILGSLVLSIKDLSTEGMGDVSVPAVVFGTIAAAICGFFAIKFMIRMISKMKLYIFAIYVGVIGVLVLLDQLYFHIFFANPFI